MNKKIVALTMSVLFGMTACLSGCSSSSSDDETTASTDSTTAETTAASESVSEENEGNSEGGTLKIWLAGSGDTTTDQAYRKIFDNWISQNEPDMDYELTFVAWSDYFSKLSVALASGEGPDLFMTGYGQLGSMVGQGYVLDLTENLPSDWDGFTDIPQNILEAGSKDGEVYGILEPATRCLMYRKDIAEQNGVTEEDLQVDSLDDLKALAEKMAVKDENGNLIMSGLEMETTAHGPSSIEQIYYVISRNYDPDQEFWNEDGTANFNNENAVNAFTYMRSFIDEGISLPTDSSDTTSGIVSGLASMAITTESNYGTANATYPDEIGIVPCSLNTLLIGNFIAVNNDSQYKDQALDALMFMFNEESLKTKATDLGMYPVRSSLVDWYNEEFPEFASLSEYYENSAPYSYTLISFFNEAMENWRTGAEEIMSTDVDIATKLEEMETQWNSLITSD